jgi:hypothetical protein
MARQWPQVNKLTHPVKRSDNVLFITVKTQMFCGVEIEKHEEAAKNKEFSTKDRLNDQVSGAAAGHIRTCETCKKKYQS